MVKNKKGGRSHKKQASRNAKDPPRTYKLRVPNVEGEIIARVTKVFGHGNADVMCNDGKTRLCVIRKKFRGRNKRDNTIILNTYVLVGIRAYEVVGPKKKPKVDLLEVYTGNNQRELHEGGYINAYIRNPDYHTSQEETSTATNSKVENSKVENSVMGFNFDEL